MDYEKLLSAFDFAELRIEKSSEHSFRLTEDQIKHAFGSSYGISVRILENGSWGFASANYGEDVKNLLKRARKIASLSKGKIRIDPDLEINKKSVGSVSSSLDFDCALSNLKELLADLKGPKITSRTVSCSDSTSIKQYYNSLGSRIVEKSARSYLSAGAVSKDGTNVQKGSTRSWSKSGFDDLDFSIATEARSMALRLLNAKSPPKGRFTVVLDPEMTGVLSHEAVGHASEADSVVDNESLLKDKVGSKIGNENVTIIDDPSASDFGFYQFDDEGVRAKPTVLVQQGVFCNYINSRESGYSLGIPLNGHARADGYDNVPIVRMSNTYFQSGKFSKSDVFDVKSGVYLKGMKGGSVDIFTGGFMFKAQEAYLIDRGELGQILRDVTISGNILKTLYSIDAVGRDFGTSPGICGKFGQHAPVSDGGPHIRITNLAIG
ncbi:TldD/PmbA family protein [Candidatus Micrarchaeota archaeon]|nr:TldD/PmbA family protein [Candidatus Micrarchaeota archaeon]